MINGAFHFPSNLNDWTETYCLKTRQILWKNQLSTWKRNFFLTEDDFKKRFGSMIKDDDFNLWLEDKILEVEVVEDCIWIVEKIPPKPNEIAPSTTGQDDEELPF